jgi:dihydroflavonol-4-reductase
MTVLVTGATGFIGSRVARLLSHQGRSPRMMFRRPHRAGLLAGLEGRLIIADLTSPPSLRRAVVGVDAIIHLAGRATFEPYEVVAPTLVEGTRSLAAAAAEAGVSRMVFASSALVYPSVDEAITSGTPAGPVVGYGQAKLEAERVLAELASTTGMRVAYPRLPHVYGAGSVLFDFVRRGVVPFPGDMTTRYSHLHVDDAARALVAAVDGELEGSLPIGDRRPVRWEEVFDTIRAYRPGLRVIDLPGTPIERLLRLIEPIRRHRHPSMVTPDAVRAWRLEQAIDSHEAWSTLGIEPLHPTVETGTPATLEEILPPEWRRSPSDRRR